MTETAGPVARVASAMRTAPRAEATAFGRWMSTLSSGRMRCPATARATVPPVRRRPARSGCSAMVMEESSRTVTRAFLRAGESRRGSLARADPIVIEERILELEGAHLIRRPAAHDHVAAHAGDGAHAGGVLPRGDSGKEEESGGEEAEPPQEVSARHLPTTATFVF